MLSAKFGTTREILAFCWLAQQPPRMQAVSCLWRPGSGPELTGEEDPGDMGNDKPRWTCTRKRKNKKRKSPCKLRLSLQESGQSRGSSTASELTGERRECKHYANWPCHRRPSASFFVLAYSSIALQLDGLFAFIERSLLSRPCSGNRTQSGHLTTTRPFV